MGTYLGFMFSLSILNLLLPQGGVIFWGTSLMISAIYLHILPLDAWIKARLIAEATNLVGYYKSVIQVHELIELRKTTGINMIMMIVNLFSENTNHAEMEQIYWTVDESINTIRNIDPNVALLVPVITIIVVYALIGGFYIYFKKIGLYRRLNIYE